MKRKRQRRKQVRCPNPLDTDYFLRFYLPYLTRKLSAISQVDEYLSISPVLDTHPVHITGKLVMNLKLYKSEIYLKFLFELNVKQDRVQSYGTYACFKTRLLGK